MRVDYSTIVGLASDLNDLRLAHYVCDGDCYYSCPASGKCCQDNCGVSCDCGADEHNAILDRVIKVVESMV